MRGTRGFVTTDDESTGSVGDSSAPTRKHSAQPKSVSARVASATITHVSGIATTSLRSGSRHAVCSISASTSSPSRNRITISATVARSSTNADSASKSKTSRPPWPRRNPATTKTAVIDRKLRCASPDARAPAISNPPKTSVATSKSVTAPAAYAGCPMRDASPVPFWLDRPRPAPAPPLEAALEAELAIVGGGFTGLWAAVLAKRERPDRAVVLLEAETAGWGARGRNGGFVDPSLTHGLVNGASRFPRELDALEHAGRANLEGFKA